MTERPVPAPRPIRPVPKPAGKPKRPARPTPKPRVPCPACNGEGLVGCPVCDGDGEVVVAAAERFRAGGD